MHKVQGPPRVEATTARRPISWVDKLSPELFWDVRREDVTPQKNLRWLVERILVYGRWNDWLVLRAHVALDELRALSAALRLPPRERVFIDKYLEATRDS